MFLTPHGAPSPVAATVVVHLVVGRPPIAFLVNVGLAPLQLHTPRAVMHRADTHSPGRFVMQALTAAPPRVRERPSVADRLSEIYDPV